MTRVKETDQQNPFVISQVVIDSLTYSESLVEIKKKKNRRHGACPQGVCGSDGRARDSF